MNWVYSAASMTVNAGRAFYADSSGTRGIEKCLTSPQKRSLENMIAIVGTGRGVSWHPGTYAAHLGRRI